VGWVDNAVNTIEAKRNYTPPPEPFKYPFSGAIPASLRPSGSTNFVDETLHRVSRARRR
jgi:hypothetical protein